MLQIYLPVAELSIDVFFLIFLGLGVGFLSGLFGIGGGFLLTPLLIFSGIPPAIAVGSQANQVIGTSLSSTMTHIKKRNIDYKMGYILLSGGILGSFIGVYIFKILRELGQIDFVISITYVIFLAIIGFLMLYESLRHLIQRKKNIRPQQKLHKHYWAHNLPYKTRFRKSRLYISALLPLAVGFFIGLVSALMGVGGGFILIPAMIYILGMSTSIVVGTSLFQIVFMTVCITILQATLNENVDIVLAIILLLGGACGAHFGTKLSFYLRGEYLRGLLAVVVLVVCFKLLLDLLIEPQFPFSLEVIEK